jgi:hypothetical protein
LLTRAFPSIICVQNPLPEINREGFHAFFI